MVVSKIFEDEVVQKWRSAQAGNSHCASYRKSCDLTVVLVANSSKNYLQGYSSLETGTLTRYLKMSYDAGTEEFPTETSN